MRNEIYTFDLAGMRAIKRDHERLLYEVTQLQHAVRQNFTGQLPPIPQKVKFLNDSGETMPAFGVGAVVLGATGTFQGVPYITLEKPSTTFRRSYAVNEGIAVSDGSYGWCWLSGEGIEVLYDVTSAIQGYGPKAGQWSLHPGYPETAIVLKISDATKSLALVKWKPITEFWGKVYGGDVAQDATGTVEIWAGTFGAEASLGMYVSGVGNPSQDLSEGDKVNCAWFNGQPEMYPRTCV